MNALQAKQQGAAAFKAGIGRAPALNKSFLVDACASGRLVEMMDSYTHGWTVAMLANGVPDENMPSVRELKELEAA